MPTAWSATRSRLLDTFIAETTLRRSEATGWKSVMIFSPSSSIFISSWSISSSSAITWEQRSVSRSSSPRTAESRLLGDEPGHAVEVAVSSSRARWKFPRMCVGLSGMVAGRSEIGCGIDGAQP